MATETIALPSPAALVRGAAMTVTLGLALLLVQLYQTSLSIPDRELFILRWAAVPMEITEATDLEPRVPFPIAGTLASSIFLHAGWLHLAGNLLLLALFGPPLERALGAWASLGLFLAGGALGAAAQAWSHPDSLVNLVGASGGAAALIGACLVAGRPPMALRLIFIAWAAMQAAELITSLDSLAWIEGGMATWSHLTGLAVGLAAGLIATRRRA